ncbi:MAG: helix-turn-helix domain-containing protein [Solirubrobacteraceae bacterium]|nr:helix-turn-helix domain-containing protein [Solirubrobacteraceae bacterium]
MPQRVCILATPDSMASPISGLFEALRSVGELTAPEDRVEGDEQPFVVEVVGERAGVLESASGLEVHVHRAVAEVDDADIVIIPSMAFGTEEEWIRGRYPTVVRWLSDMHGGGATICAACTGTNLAAETGLLDGCEATVHWASVTDFRRRHPEVRLRPADALVIAGDGGRLVTSGASSAWHDLALYLIARDVGPSTAQAVARFLLWQWHQDGQAPFQVFAPPTDHGDAAILAAQRGIAERFSVASPVDEMVGWSGLPARTFARRFKAATGHTPIDYVQRIRIEQAKRMLETSTKPVDEISWGVGYEDPASFRRLFKRLTGMAPRDYRQRFTLPDTVAR